MFKMCTLTLESYCVVWLQKSEITVPTMRKQKLELRPFTKNVLVFNSLPIKEMFKKAYSLLK